MIIQRKKIKVNKANASGDTFKVGLPKQFAQVLDVEVGDSIEWRLNYVDEKLVITVVKAIDK